MDSASRLETLINGYSDLDWVWWPFQSLRPPPHQTMGVSFAARSLVICAGQSLLGGLCLAVAEPQVLYMWDRHTGHVVAGWSSAFMLHLSRVWIRAYGFGVFCGVVASAALYVWLIAFYWNRRARRLGRPEGHTGPGGVWPPPPVRPTA